MLIGALLRIHEQVIRLYELEILEPFDYFEGVAGPLPNQKGDNMQSLKLNELGQLISDQPKPCVSLYLPVEHFQNEAEARGAITKSLRAAHQLIEKAEGAHKARFLIEPLKDVVSLIKRPPPEGTKTLALFRSFTMAAFHASALSTKELAVVADTFHLKPFLRTLQGLDRYFVLSLSQRKATLYCGTECSFERLGSFDAEFGETGAGKSESNVIHLFERKRGKRGGFASPRSRAMRFLKEVEAKVWEHLRDESAPLVLAGTPFLHQLYRSLNRYGNIAEQGVQSSFTTTDTAALHRASFRIVDRLLTIAALEAAERFHPRRRIGLASGDLEEVARAAVRGRVSTLFIRRDSHLWGVLDRREGGLELRDAQKDTRDDDVLDDIAQEVITRRGRVFVMEKALMPEDSPIAALYRW